MLEAEERLGGIRQLLPHFQQLRGLVSRGGGKKRRRRRKRRESTAMPRTPANEAECTIIIVMMDSVTIMSTDATITTFSMTI